MAFGAGYWPANGQPDRYWVDDYWPDTGTPPPPPDYLPSMDEMSYAQYQTVGTWRIERAEFGNQLRLALIDPRKKIEVNLPQQVWSRDDFPNIRKDDEGEAKPIVYGSVLRAPAFLVDSATKEFRVAGHAITSFDQFLAGGDSFSPTTQDLATASFTWDAYDDESLEIGFTGYALTNPADVVEHLLEQQAELAAGDVDATVLAAGRAKWRVGIDPRTLAEKHSPELSVYIDGSKVTDVMDEISQTAFGVFYVGRDGAWSINAWEPQAGEGLLTLKDEDIFDLSVEMDSTSPITQCLFSYQRLVKAGSSGFATETSEEYRLRRGLTAHEQKSFKLLHATRNHARLAASRMLRMRGVPSTIYTATVNQKAATLNPGEFIRLTYSTRDVDAVVEVLEVKHDPTSAEVDLVCGNVRGLEDEPGFWVGDTPSFPARLGGTITAWGTAWSDDQKQWAKENVGFWADDDGYSDTGQDATGHNITVWS